MLLFFKCGFLFINSCKAWELFQSNLCYKVINIISCLLAHLPYLDHAKRHSYFCLRQRFIHGHEERRTVTKLLGQLVLQTRTLLLEIMIRDQILARLSFPSDFSSFHLPVLFSRYLLPFQFLQPFLILFLFWKNFLPSFLILLMKV